MDGCICDRVKILLCAWANYSRGKVFSFLSSIERKNISLALEFWFFLVTNDALKSQNQNSIGR